MKIFPALILAAVLGSGLAAQAATPAPKQSCELTLDADKVDGDTRNQSGVVATGNVVVTQCDMKMRADTVRATMANGHYDKIIANGKIVLVSQRAGVVTGDNGVYEVARKLVTLTGRVVLKDGKNVLTGTRGTYNLATGVAMVDAPSATPGTGSGRVHAVLNPQEAAPAK